MFGRSDSEGGFIVKNDRIVCYQIPSIPFRKKEKRKHSNIKSLNGFAVINDEIGFYHLGSSEIKELEKRKITKKKLIASMVLFTSLMGVGKAATDVMDILGVTPDVQTMNPNSVGTEELRNIMNIDRTIGVKIAVIDKFGNRPAIPKTENIVLSPELVMGKEEKQDHGENVTRVVLDTLNQFYKDKSTNIKIMPIGLDNDLFNNNLPSAIRYAVDSGAKVINLSICNPDATEGNERNIQKAIDYAYRKGVVVVAAAGNLNHYKGRETENYPSMLNRAISVTAAEYDENDRYNRRPTDYTVTNEGTDFTAWGTHYVLGPNGMKIPFDGTSSAAPEVSAKIAAIYDMLLKKYSVVTVDMVIEVAKNAADSKDDRTHEEGWGMIDLGRASKYIEMTTLLTNKAIRPPRVVWFDFDMKTSELSFDIIDENKFDTKDICMKIIGFKSGPNGVEKFVADNVRLARKKGKYTANLSQFPDGKYSVKISGIENYKGEIQKPIIRNLTIDR